MENNCPAKGKCLGAILIAVSLVLSAFLISDGLRHFRSFDRVVTVKGLSVKEVEADIAYWPIAHVITGDDLETLQVQIDKNSDKIVKYLLSQGIPTEDIGAKTINVYDKAAQIYGENNTEKNRYIITENINVTTHNLDALEKALQNSGDLIKDGITLVRERDPMGPGNPSYIYTKINDIKPQMIAEATKSARESAEQFAHDSGAKVTAIHQADQGLFVIMPRMSDQSYLERSERYKTIRAVTTIKFYIE